MMQYIGSGLVFGGGLIFVGISAALYWAFVAPSKRTRHLGRGDYGARLFDWVPQTFGLLALVFGTSGALMIAGATISMYMHS